MPNWALGNITATGKKKNIRDFITYCFIWEDDIPIKDESKKYFARSFINESYNGFIDRFNNELKKVSDDEETSFEFNVNFAWSAATCIIPLEKSYVNEFADTCIDLSSACRKYVVDVKIHTEEFGMCFEEYIYCNKNGVILLDEVVEIKSYICKNCENEQHFGSSEEEFLCYECDESGIENWILEE